MEEKFINSALQPQHVQELLQCKSNAQFKLNSGDADIQGVLEKRIFKPMPQHSKKNFFLRHPVVKMGLKVNVVKIK